MRPSEVLCTKRPKTGTVRTTGVRTVRDLQRDPWRRGWDLNPRSTLRGPRISSAVRSTRLRHLSARQAIAATVWGTLPLQARFSSVANCHFRLCPVSLMNCVKPARPASSAFRGVVNVAQEFASNGWIGTQIDTR